MSCGMNGGSANNIFNREVGIINIFDLQITKVNASLIDGDNGNSETACCFKTVIQPYNIATYANVCGVG